MMNKLTLMTTLGIGYQGRQKDGSGSVGFESKAFCTTKPTDLE